MQREYLKGLLMQRGHNVQWLAKLLKINVNTAYQKLNGETQFKYNEITLIRQELTLSEDEFKNAFPF